MASNSLKHTFQQPHGYTRLQMFRNMFHLLVPVNYIRTCLSIPKGISLQWAQKDQSTKSSGWADGWTLSKLDIHWYWPPFFNVSIGTYAEENLISKISVNFELCIAEICIVGAQKNPSESFD